MNKDISSCLFFKKHRFRSEDLVVGIVEKNEGGELQNTSNIFLEHPFDVPLKVDCRILHFSARS